MSDVIEVHMLTTTDNPYDPFTHYKEWYEFDTSMGYNSTNYLARVAKTSDSLSEANNIYEINQAIDSIVKLNVLGIYKKVTRKYEDIEI